MKELGINPTDEQIKDMAMKALFNEHLTTIIEKQAVEEMAAY